MTPQDVQFASVTEAVEAIRNGRMVVVVDDEDRENEGDLTLAAEFVTPEAINFMARFGRGLICLTLTEERADYLRLAPMVADNTSRFGTAFTESVEAREGVTTGISAADRAHTIRVAIAPGSTAQDLARMAGLVPAGVICEIMNDDGSMARVADLRRFCAEHGLLLVTVADLIRYRLQHERYLRRAAESVLPTAFGDFRMIAYENEIDRTESHVALVMGEVSTDQPALVRVHTHALAEDVFGLLGSDNREVLEGSLRSIAQAGRGALLYLHNGTPGFTIDRSVEPHRIVFQRDPRSRTRDAAGRDPRGGERTLRQVGLGAQILADLGIRRIRLLTNTPTHVPALQGFGIEIVEQVPVGIRQPV